MLFIIPLKPVVKVHIGVGLLNTMSKNDSLIIMHKKKNLVVRFIAY